MFSSGRFSSFTVFFFSLSLSRSLSLSLSLSLKPHQLEFVYPHIARVDAEKKTNEEWLRSLNDRNFHFSSWGAAGRRGPHPGGKGKRKAQMVGGVIEIPAGGEERNQRPRNGGGDRA